jgi:hypothetical protein
VQPERVLVERQARADAEPRRGDLEPWARRLQRQREPRREQQHDPEGEMVHMQPALGLDAPRPPGGPLAAHQPRARPDEQEREQERRQDDQPGPGRGDVEEAVALQLDRQRGDHGSPRPADDDLVE